MAVGGRTVYDEASGWLLTPVGARGEDWGRVILVCDRPPAPADSVLIERAATTLALGRLLARHRESLERQAHRTLISGIISQAHADPAEAAVRARALGVPVDGRQLIALVLRFRNPEPGPLGISAHARVLDLADAAAAACGAERIPSLVGTLDDARAGAMLSLGPRAEPDDVLARLAAQVTDRVGAVVIGVGAAVGSIRDVRRSFLEAGQVADVAAARPAGRDAAAEPPFYRLDDLRLRGLLHLLRDDPRLQTFVERELGALLAEEGRGLIGVLAAYLAAGGNKAEAAKAANLARPTFYDRLGRIERILGTDLRAAESRTSLHVALLALAASRADAGPGGLWYEYASPARASGRLSSTYRGRRRGQPVSRAAGTEPGPGPTGMFGADDEVGRDLDAVDWAATPLGPPGSWPQSLQTAVDILLSSRFSMWMAWGPQLTFFCNAAYRRDTLGRKYPWALGRPPVTCGRRSGRTSARVSAPCWPRGRRPGTRPCCCSWSDRATRRRPTTPFPTVRCGTTPAPWSACCAWSARKPNASSVNAGWRRCAIWAPTRAWCAPMPRRSSSPDASYTATGRTCRSP